MIGLPRAVFRFGVDKWGWEVLLKFVFVRK